MSYSNGSWRGRGGRGGGVLRARSHSSDDTQTAVVDHNQPVESRAELSRTLQALNGANYGALKQLTQRSFQLAESSAEASVVTAFLRIQADPFAPGSQICLSTTIPLTRSALVSVLARPGALTGLSAEIAMRTASIAVEDYVLRCFIRHVSTQQGSRAVETAVVSQHVLQRDAVELTLPDGHDATTSAQVRVYFRAKLPGHGRRVDGPGIAAILFGVLAAAGRGVARLCTADLLAHVACVLNQEWLRAQLTESGLVAFVRDGAILPRVDGIHDAPLGTKEAVPFASPPSLSRTFELPYTGEAVSGMALPVGLTLIAGGGYHGKSTLLRALELGVYNHIRGDGRELVVTDPTAVKVRAEDCRYVDGVDVSPFIHRLPSGKTTTAFCTTSASGSTSQAAGIVEALELDSHALLFDEDTSATNILFRDALMAELVPSSEEPITPFVKRARELVDRHGCSVIMVVGGSGLYFPLAERVLVMQSYRVMDKTCEAKAIAARAGLTDDSSLCALTPATPAAAVGSADGSAPPAFLFPGHRVLHHRESFAALAREYRGREHGKMSGAGMHRLRLGADVWVDLSLVEQLVEDGQANALAQSVAMLYDLHSQERARQWLLSRSHTIPQTRRPLSVFAQYIYTSHACLGQSGLRVQTPSCFLARGFSAMPRAFEVGAALNRMRGLRTGPL